jgi:chaperonin cofactor prefoldin
MQMNQAAMVGGGRGGGTREEIQELQMRYETAQMSCAKLRQEIKNKDYDVRRSEMALAALGQETAEADTATYKQVGRMFMQCDLDEIVADTKTTIAKAKADKERLEKNRVHMERQVKEVRGEIQEIMPRTQG